jgi:hypothetical protein
VLLVVPFNIPRRSTLQVTPRALTLLCSLPPPEPGHAVGLVRVIITTRRMPSTAIYHREICVPAGSPHSPSCLPHKVDVYPPPLSTLLCFTTPPPWLVTQSLLRYLSSVVFQSHVCHIHTLLHHYTLSPQSTSPSCLALRWFVPHLPQPWMPHLLLRPGRI